MALSASLLLLILVLATTLWLLFARKNTRLPPGPKGKPVLGHYGQIPSEGPWHFFRDLGRNYGQSTRI